MGQGLICSQLQPSAKYERVNKLRPRLGVHVCGGGRQDQEQEQAQERLGSPVRMMRRKKQQPSGGSEPGITS